MKQEANVESSKAVRGYEDFGFDSEKMGPLQSGFCIVENIIQICVLLFYSWVTVIINVMA